MNVEVEHLPNCQVSLRVVLPADRVAKERSRISNTYQSRAKIPGYRPGKAPQSIVAVKFKKEIEDELKRVLVDVGFREAVKEQGIRALSITEVDEVRFDEETGMRFRAKAVTAPQFELPEYKGIPIAIPSTEVTEAEIDVEIEGLRERTAEFVDFEDRTLQEGDFAVMNLDSTIEGKPVGECSPSAAKTLQERKDLWLRIAPDSFLPGFTEPLIGAKKGETREYSVTVPADFPDTTLAGKMLDVKCEITATKTRTLPEVTDEWAGKVGTEPSIETLRKLIADSLKSQKAQSVGEARRRQILDFLHSKIECELPASYVHRETRRIVENIVRENQTRGIADDTLKEKEDEIVQNATGAARNRVKTAFILTRIAESEGIKVTESEFNARLRTLSVRHEMTVEKLVKLLEQNNSFGPIEEELLIGKVLEFLDNNASVSEVAIEAPQN